AEGRREGHTFLAYVPCSVCALRLRRARDRRLCRSPAEQTGSGRFRKMRAFCFTRGKIGLKRPPRPRFQLTASYAGASDDRIASKRACMAESVSRRQANGEARLRSSKVA